MNKGYKGYLIDLDGTMYKGNESIPEAADFIERLRRSNKPFLFLTNNSTANAKGVVENLKRRSNVEAYPNEVFTSTDATLHYLKEKNVKRVHVIGEAGLLEGLLASGIEIADENVDAVVVGLDTEVNYAKLMKATLLIQAGAEFIGTNPDTNMPTELGLVPGNGALLSFLETSTGTQATVIGKPQAIIMDAALDVLGLSKDEVLMVGDNYKTDIQAGIRNEIDTLLVLTGFTSEADVATLPTPATYVIDTLNDWDII